MNIGTTLLNWDHEVSTTTMGDALYHLGQRVKSHDKNEGEFKGYLFSWDSSGDTGTLTLLCGTDRLLDVRWSLTDTGAVDMCVEDGSFSEAGLIREEVSVMLKGLDRTAFSKIPLNLKKLEQDAPYRTIKSLTPLKLKEALTDHIKTKCLKWSWGHVSLTSLKIERVTCELGQIDSKVVVTATLSHAGDISESVETFALDIESYSKHPPVKTKGWDILDGMPNRWLEGALRDLNAYALPLSARPITDFYVPGESAWA